MFLGHVPSTSRDHIADLKKSLSTVRFHQAQLFLAGSSHCLAIDHKFSVMNWTARNLLLPILAIPILMAFSERRRDEAHPTPMPSRFSLIRRLPILTAGNGMPRPQRSNRLSLCWVINPLIECKRTHMAKRTPMTFFRDGNFTDSTFVYEL